MKIFWSWQSDNDEKSGRYFVRDVLNDLVKELNDLDEMEEFERGDDVLPPLEVDHDTKGVAGTPPIADTILEKIREAAVFIADVTPVGETHGKAKKLANPNVMIELGYALKALGYRRIVLVANEWGNAAIDGIFNAIPFDLVHLRRPIIYHLAAGADKDTRNAAAKLLKSRLKGAVALSVKQAQAEARDALKNRPPAPDLSVQIVGLSKEPRFCIAAVDDIPVPTLEELRRKYPPQPIPENDPPSSFRPSARLMAFGFSRPIIGPDQWTREETEKYNDRLELFYSSYQSYVRKLNEYNSLMARTAEFMIELSNDGTLPGERVDVYVSMPDGAFLYKDRKGVQKPFEPTPPSLNILDDHSARIFYPESPSFDLNVGDIQTRVDTSKQLVRYRRGDITHGYVAYSEPFLVSLSGEEGLQSFPYSIRAANVPTEVKGLAVLEVLVARRHLDPFEDEERDESQPLV